MSNYWLDEYKVKVPVVLWTNKCVNWIVWEMQGDKVVGDEPLFHREAETGKTVYMHEYEGDLTVSIWAMAERLAVRKGVITKDGLKVVI